jgi:hypothetical protein
MSFVGSYCLFLALAVKFSPLLRSGENFTTRAKNKQCYSLVIGLSVHALIYILLIFKFDLYRGACGGGR